MSHVTDSLAGARQESEFHNGLKIRSINKGELDNGHPVVVVLKSFEAGGAVRAGEATGRY